MEVTNSPPSFDNNISLNNIALIKNDLNKSGENNIPRNDSKIIAINSCNNKDNKLIETLDQKIMDVHIKLWEILMCKEFHFDGKIGLGNQLKKLLVLIENEFINNNINGEIFINSQLNHIHCSLKFLDRINK